jgi:hypothetical protein
VGSTLATTLVIIVIVVTTVTFVDLGFTRGESPNSRASSVEYSTMTSSPGHPRLIYSTHAMLLTFYNSNVTGKIRKCQRSNSDERSRMFTPCVHFLTCFVFSCLSHVLRRFIYLLSDVHFIYIFIYLFI